MHIEHVATVLVNELIRRVTGRLLTDEQIKAVSQHAVGRHFAGLLPETQEEQSAQQRVEAARTHISEASSIISDIKGELDSQTAQLSVLLDEIEQKKALAERYETLAKTNRDQFDAFRSEMEETVRDELVEQANKDVGIRRLVSFLLWLITLFLGAALGHYFANIVSFFKGLL